MAKKSNTNKTMDVFQACETLKKAIELYLDVQSVEIEHRITDDNDKALEASIYYFSNGENLNYSVTIYSFNSNLTFTELQAKLINKTRELVLFKDESPKLVMPC
jgi:hypothetical protein